MTADTILSACRDAGLTVRLGDAGTLLVTPAARITPELRALIRDYKADLLLALCEPVQDDLDDRVRCTDCRNLWKASYCVTHRAAGLACRDLAQEFTHLRQRCPAFAPLARAQAP